MIIEFTGIPGSGKSTVLKELEKNLNKSLYIFNIEKYLINCNNVLLFDLFLLLNFFKLKFNDWKLLLKVIYLLKNNKTTFLHKLNIIRNSYKKLLIYRLLNQHKGLIFFVDEGISHIPFNVFVDGVSEFEEKDIEKFVQLLPKPDKLLIIDAEDEILLERVIKRGHKRMDFSDLKKVKKFMQQSRSIIEILKKHYSNEIYINESNINIEILKTKLGLSNV